MALSRLQVKVEPDAVELKEKLALVELVSAFGSLVMVVVGVDVTLLYV